MRGIHLSPETQFKPGQISKKILPVGSITVRRDKGGKPRAWIKITDTGHPSDWKLRAVFVWEKAHGPLANGQLVHHRDRNTLNDQLDNLELLTRAEHLNEHRMELARRRSAAANRAKAIDI
jgi:hypothetical protein